MPVTSQMICLLVSHTIILFGVLPKRRFLLRLVRDERVDFSLRALRLCVGSISRKGAKAQSESSCRLKVDSQSITSPAVLSYVLDRDRPSDAARRAAVPRF